MSPTMRVDDDIWEHLKKNSSFVDTPSDVLRRLLSITKPTPQRPAVSPPNGTKYLLRADRDYANLPITSYEFEGKHSPVRTFKEVLVKMCETLRSRHGDSFDNLALRLHGKKRSYFARSSSELKHPRSVAGGGVGGVLYVESNLSATAVMGLCQHLIRRLGHDVSSFRVH